MKYTQDKNEKNYKVYKHTNLVNNKVYIGVTCQEPNDRWKNGKGYRENIHFARAIDKYGWEEGFLHEILYDNLCKEEAYQLEKELIEKYESTNYEKGYNMTPGGLGGCSVNLSEETLEKYRQRTMDRNGFFGKRHTDETRQKISDSLRKRPYSEETVKKRNETLSKRKELRQNCKVRCLQNNIIYNCINDAADSLNIHRSRVAEVCFGQTYSCYGYRFEFIYE